MSGLKIQTEKVKDELLTMVSYLKENEYEVYVTIKHPFTAIHMAIVLKTLSDKIIDKENSRGK